MFQRCFPRGLFHQPSPRPQVCMMAFSPTEYTTQLNGDVPGPWLSPMIPKWSEIDQKEPAKPPKIMLEKHGKPPKISKSQIEKNKKPPQKKNSHHPMRHRFGARCGSWARRSSTSTRRTTIVVPERRRRHGTARRWCGKVRWFQHETWECHDEIILSSMVWYIKIIYIYNIPYKSILFFQDGILWHIVMTHDGYFSWCWYCRIIIWSIWMTHVK